jgi:hypothetical protein
MCCNLMQVLVGGLSHVGWTTHQGKLFGRKGHLDTARSSSTTVFVQPLFVLLRWFEV